MNRKIPIGVITGKKDEFLQGDNAPSFFVNMYFNDGYKSVFGKTEFCDTGSTAGVRGGFESEVLSKNFFIQNNTLYVLSATGTKTSLGAVTITADRITWCESATKVFFAGGGYIYMTDGATITTLSSGPTSVTHVAFLGGYLLANGNATWQSPVVGDVHYSDDSAGSYADWETFNNEQKPDPTQAIVAIWGELYGIGTQTIEVSYIDGDTPFALNKQATQEVGTVAPYSVAFNQEALIFLSVINGQRMIVQLAGGRNPKNISFPVDVDISKFSTVSDAYADLVSFDGQTFYRITFPSAQVTLDDQFYESITLDYHLQTGAWSRSLRYNKNTALYTQDVTGCFWSSKQIGKQLIGGIDGIIYAIDKDSMTDGTYPLMWVMRTGHVAYGSPSAEKMVNRYTHHIRRGFDIPNGYTWQDAYAYVVNNRVRGSDDNLYICTTAHTSSSSDMPVSGANYLAYWEQIGSYTITHRWRNNHETTWSNGRSVSMGTVGTRYSPTFITRCGRYNVRQHELSGDFPVILDGIEEEFEVAK